MEAEVSKPAAACEAAHEKRQPLTIQNIRRASIKTAFERHQCAIEIQWTRFERQRGFVFQKEPDSTGTLQPWYFASEEGEICLTEWNGSEHEIPNQLEAVYFEVLSAAEAVEMQTRIQIQSVTPEDPQAKVKAEIEKYCTEAEREKRRSELARLKDIPSLREMFRLGTPFQGLIIQQVETGDFQVLRDAPNANELLNRCPRTLRIATMATLMRAKMLQETDEEISLEEVIEIGAQFFCLLVRLRDFLKRDYRFQRMPGDFGASSIVFEELISTQNNLTTVTLALMARENLKREKGDGLLDRNEEQHEAIREDTQLDVLLLMIESNRQDLELAGLDNEKIYQLPMTKIVEILNTPPTQTPSAFPSLPDIIRRKVVQTA